ncbi:TraR/DksA family transcriptional regulator [Amnibacterium endophyticum]|uniref:TraR/DksA family transcriptional regulator n=1 Tax=Amnibacterium endophyticum TaxID=2109337 RepID=A0ABW4LHN8_9MICO
MEDEARRRVLAVREDALRTVAELDRRIHDVVTARADANSDDEHDPEGATLAFERSQADAIRAAALRRLDDAEQAMRRLDSGEYGRCAVCGEPIPEGRLEARPLTDRCVRHA